MKHLKLLIPILTICLNAVVTAQNITIKIDTIIGCSGPKSVTSVTFSFTHITPPAKPDTSIIWNSGEGVIDSVGTTNKVTFQYTLADNNYQRIIKVITNHSDTAHLVFDIYPCIDVPNVFTPNGDKINDVITIGLNDKNILTFKLLTRSGILIYQAEGKVISWDGILGSGSKILPGIYFYTLECSKTVPPINKKGFIYVFY